MEPKHDADQNLHALSILQNLDRMMKEKQHCDLIIKAEEEELHVHKNVVAAGSDYFMAMLFHENIESTSGVVVMKGVKFVSVKACIIFIYTGKIAIHEANYENVLEVASIMQLTTVRSKIVQFMRVLLSPSSFFNVKKLADKFDLVGLRKVTNDFALAKLDLIVKETGFNYLEQEYVSFLVSSKMISPLYEDSKLAIVLQWINAEVNNRKNCLMKMLGLVNLKNLSDTYGRYLAENEPLCRDSAECMKMFYLAATDTTQTEEQAKLGSIAFKDDTAANAVLVFDITSNTLQTFKPGSNTWTPKQTLHKDMQSGRYVAVVIKTHLYVLTAKKNVYILDLFDIASDWVMVKSMTRVHGKYIRAAAHGDTIYVVGNNSMEKYDKWKNDWTPIECDGMQLNECALVEHRGFIFALGGFNEAALSNVNKLSVETSLWDSVKPMHIPKRTAAASSQGNMIFVAGGYEDDAAISDVEQYDSMTDGWTKLTSMGKCLGEFSLCCVDRKLFAIGKYRKPLDIEEYDENTHTWKTVVETNDEMRVVGPASVAVCFPE